MVLFVGSRTADTCVGKKRGASIVLGRQFEKETFNATTAWANAAIKRSDLMSSHATQRCERPGNVVP